MKVSFVLLVAYENAPRGQDFKCSLSPYEEFVVSLQKGQSVCLKTCRSISFADVVVKQHF